MVISFNPDILSGLIVSIGIELELLNENFKGPFTETDAGIKNPLLVDKSIL